MTNCEQWNGKSHRVDTNYFFGVARASRADGKVHNKI
jgi:hypothetical protein